MAGFAVLALILAAIGIYGVAATMVVQRTHEIGVRMALGAQRRDVLRLVVGKGLGMTAVGLLIGVALSVGLTRLMENLLADMVDSSTLLFIGFAAAVAFVSLLGSYVPARRAARVDPMIALRHD
jgi:putative ABC transport system permease protein